MEPGLRDLTKDAMAESFAASLAMTRAVQHGLLTITRIYQEMRSFHSYVGTAHAKNKSPDRLAARGAVRSPRGFRLLYGILLPLDFQVFGGGSD